MAPSFTTNNAMLINGVVSNGTWTLITPANYTNLSFLTSGGHNGRTIGVAVHHQDGSVERGSFISPDWFSGANPAVTANGRVNVQTFGFENVNSGNPRMYSRDITLGNISSPVVSIDLTNGSASGGDAGMFAVSGTTPTSGTWTPIAVSGYNADMIVEASAPQPTFFGTATTATMDAGSANNGNTWFEAGYDRFLPTNGLPAAGSTITSANQSDHHYKMAPDYTANNVVLLDSFFTSGNLTPATPASFSALAFLAAGASGDVLINALVQHQDGSSESLSFTARDWFNNSPVAYNVNGRINLNTRALTDENASPLNPRLYEPQIALGNTVSPVTNISLSYAGNGTARATIFALSGTAGAVPPIIDASPGSVITYEGVDEAFTATISGGTPPFTYRWQKGTNGIYANLSDGGNITGATTTSLTVHSVGLSDAADYRLAVSNVAGSANSGVATLTVISALPDVTAPGDPITSFGGPSAGGEEVVHPIDNSTSKYLNFGQNTTPFGGPVGLIVTPAFGLSRVTVMRLYTANDAPERDPADYILEGSNDGGASYTLISSGLLALPTARNTVITGIDPLTHAMQQISFPNTGSYTTYRLTFTHVKLAGAANSCQIGEVELLGVVGHAAAVLSVVAHANGSLTITSSAPGELQSTTSLNGPNPVWIDAGPISAPVTIFPAPGEPQKFYRVLLP